MRQAAFLLLLAAPLLELALLIKLGQAIGFWLTLLLILGTAAVGIVVARAQGMGVLRRMMDSSVQGRAPVAAVVEGSLLFIAGGLLISPGPIGDVLGLLLLVPPLRQLLAGWAVQRMERSGSLFTFEVHQSRPPRNDGEPPLRGGRARGQGGGTVIEVEYERLDEPTAEPKRDPPQSR